MSVAFVVVARFLSSAAFSLNWFDFNGEFQESIMQKSVKEDCMLWVFLTIGIIICHCACHNSLLLLVVMFNFPFPLIFFFTLD